MLSNILAFMRCFISLCVVFVIVAVISCSSLSSYFKVIKKKPKATILYQIATKLWNTVKGYKKKQKVNKQNTNKYAYEIYIAMKTVLK